MPEVVCCPRCQRKSRVPDSLAGKKVKCPGCAEIFTADAGSAAPPAPKEPEPAKKPEEEDGGAFEVVDDDKPKRRRGDDDDDEDVTARKKRRRDDEDEDDDERPSRRKRFSRDDEDDDDEDEEDRPRRPPARRQGGSDNFGIASVVLGSVSLVMIPLGCCCGLLWFATLPLAIVGGVLSFWARDSMRVLGMVLNLLGFLAGAALCVIIIVGVALPAAMGGGAPNGQPPPWRVPARPPAGMPGQKR